MRDFRLEIHFSKWEFNARYNMTASDMESMTLSDLLALADAEDKAAWESLWLGYTQTFGADKLRDCIAATYENISAEQLLCFAGAEEGIYVAMHCLLEKDDHAIVVVPNYQAAETVPLSICEVTGVALNSDKNWELDIDAVAAAIKPNTRLISINFPHNPTGKILEHDRYHALIDLCRKHKLYLFSDEVYRGIERQPELRLAQAVDIYEKGISLNVMSKAYGLPGLRIGWIACREQALLVKMERMKHYLSICNAAPSEQLAIIALKAREQILKKNRQLVTESCNKLNEFFQSFPELFDWQAPDGGCVAYPRYLGKDGVEAFTNNLIEKIGVLFLPASLYASELCDTPNDRFRVGFGRAHTDEGIQVLRNYLMSNK